VAARAGLDLRPADLCAHRPWPHLPGCHVRQPSNPAAACCRSTGAGSTRFAPVRLAVFSSPSSPAGSTRGQRGQADMRILLIEPDDATASQLELMLKMASCVVYRTDLGEEGVDLGKLY